MPSTTHRPTALLSEARTAGSASLGVLFWQEHKYYLITTRNVVNGSALSTVSSPVVRGEMGQSVRQSLTIPEIFFPVTSKKKRQSAKIAELRRVLMEAGYCSLDQQADALGLCRSTTWTILKAGHKASGLSGSVINQMRNSTALPEVARRWIDGYVAEKLSGAYGHSTAKLRIFRSQVQPIAATLVDTTNQSDIRSVAVRAEPGA